MSLRKLFGAVSVAALIAGGAASAQTLTLTADPAMAPILLAEESDFTGDIEGVLPTASVMTTTPLPIANGYLLTINLTGAAEFASTLDDAAIVPSPVASADVITSTVDPQQAIFVINTSAADVMQIDLDLPVAITGCGGDVTIDVELTDAAGTPIEGGVASLTDGGMPAAMPPVAPAALNLLECEDAYQVTLVSDVVADDDEDTLLELDADFAEFVDDGSASDTATTATLGDFEVAITPMTVRSDGAGAFVATDVADIESVAFSASFTDITNLSSVDTLGANADSIALSGTGADTADFDFAPPVVGTGTLTLTVSGGAGDAVTPQQPAVIDDLVTFVAAAGLVDEPFTGATSLDGLELEGANFGPFDWVGDTSTIAVTVFRGTGFTPGAEPDAVVTLTNSSTGNNDTYPITVTATGDAGQGQIVVTNGDIEAVAGPYGIADVTLTFFTGDPLDIDRLIATDGVVSAFGDDGNFDANEVILGDRQTTIAD